MASKKADPLPLIACWCVKLGNTKLTIVTVDEVFPASPASISARVQQLLGVQRSLRARGSLGMLAGVGAPLIQGFPLSQLISTICRMADEAPAQELFFAVAAPLCRCV
jgi:hypothetical protein